MTSRFACVLSCFLLLMVLQTTAQTFRAKGEYPVEGSPYMEEVFSKGTVYLKDQSNNVELRYNIYTDEIEFKSGGSAKSISPNGQVRKVVIGSLTFVPKKYMFKGQPIDGFFVNLDSGKISIFRKLNIVLTAYVPAAPLQDAKPETYVRKADTYFVQIGTEPLAEIRSIKKLIQSLPDHQQEMEAFVKKEKISADKPEELKMFVQHYQSLQQ